MFLKRLGDVTGADVLALVYAKSLCRGALALAAGLVVAIAVQVYWSNSLEAREAALRRQLLERKAARSATMPAAVSSLDEVRK